MHPILGDKFYSSHDGIAHVARFAAYFKAFSDGQIPPRWAADLNSGYGSPLFIFFYPLPGYLASFIHIFNIEFETIFKIIVSLSFFLAPVSLFIWLESKVKSEVAFAASIIYLVVPYRILDTLVRGDVAELLSFVFVPLVFLAIDKAQENKNLTSIILGGIVYGFLILSHNAIAFIFAPVLFFYAIIFAKNREDLSRSLLIFFLGLLLSFFFWFPSIVEGKFVLSRLFVENIYKDNFIPLFNLIYSNWGFGPEVNVRGGQSPQIGILYFLVPLLSAFFIRKLRKQKEVIFWLIVFLASIFMTTSLSKYLWDSLPVIKLMGYPWRFTALSSFASCMIILYFLKTLKSKFILWSVVLLFILISVPLVRVKGYENKRSDTFYNSYQGTTDYHRRTSTIWTEGDFANPAKSQIDIIGGEAQISNLKRNSILHRFSTTISRDSQFLDNTVYFPGWKVTVDGKEIPIEFQDMNHRGLITFRVPKDLHDVSVRFEETRVRLISDFVSGIAMLIILGILSRRWILKSH